MKKLFSNIKGDIFGGITAGIVALPLALAFGVSSGLGPSAGLYGAIFISFFAALFGGTSTQISGPTAPMTAVSMIVIAGIVAANDGDVTKALPAILTVFLLAGLFQVILGLAGVGKYIRYIPYPVVSGFMTAIGLIILLTQILPSVGYYPKEDVEFVNKFKAEAQEVILQNILKEEAGEKILVLENFEETSNSKIIQDYQKHCQKSMGNLVQGLFDIFDKYLLAMSETEEDKIFLEKSKADYMRYLAEVDSDDKHKQTSKVHYEAAIKMASNLGKNTKTYIGLMLNYSVFL